MITVNTKGMRGLFCSSGTSYMNIELGTCIRSVNTVVDSDAVSFVLFFVRVSNSRLRISIGIDIDIEYGVFR